MRTRAAVALEAGKPLEVMEVNLEGPKAGEVMVEIKATGICHTDEFTRSGADPEGIFPSILGHEGAGVVVKVGPGVTSVKPGDHVIPLYTPECRQCKSCLSGKTNLCTAIRSTQGQGLMPDGTSRFSYNGEPLYHYMGCSTFSEYTVVAEVSLAKVNPNANPEQVCLLGCGVMAGFGAAVNTGGVKRGDSVAVIGCGGVGMAAIAGARLAGATTVIAIDISDAKLERAKNEFGATHTINSKDLSDDELTEKVQELTGGFGVDVAIESVGQPKTYRQAFYIRDLAGRVVLVGVPTPDMTLELPFLDVFGRGGSLKSSWYGDCLPERDFPMYVDLFQQGRFPLDKFVDDRVQLDGVQSAMEEMDKGQVLRSVVEFK